MPIVHVMRSPILMMVHPSVPAKTVPEFIAYAKANPNRLSMGSGGSGSSGHLAGELFMMRAGIKLIHVPYRGESVAMTDVLAGQPQVLFATSGSSIAFVKSGAVRALAVTSARRLEQLPEVPAMAEFLPGYEASGWSGLCAPKNTPVTIVGLLNKQVNDALTSADIRKRILDMGGVAPGGSSADFAKYIAEVLRLWTASFAQRKDLAPEDRAYVARLVVAQTGLSPDEAQKRVDQVVTEAKSALDQARHGAAKLSFWLTAALLFGAFAASLAAVEGGMLRDGAWNDRVLVPRTL